MKKVIMYLLISLTSIRCVSADNGPVRFIGTVLTYETSEFPICYEMPFVDVTVDMIIDGWDLLGYEETLCYAEELGLQPGEVVEVYAYAWKGVCPFQCCGHIVAGGDPYYVIRYTSDSDGDGISNSHDNCPNDYNPHQEDSDEDDIGDICDSCPNDPDNDADSDGICGDIDNCPTMANSDQTDSDDDGIGNVCDEDCPNLDGLNPVNLIDFSILAHDWQQTSPELTADLDGNGFVDTNDLEILAVYWLSGCN